jgi:hypothetical protein
VLQAATASTCLRGACGRDGDAPCRAWLPLRRQLLRHAVHEPCCCGCDLQDLVMQGVSAAQRLQVNGRWREDKQAA